MADRDALERSLTRTLGAWLPTMSEAELRIVDAVVTEVLMRREREAAEDNAAALEPPAFVGTVDELAAHVQRLEDGADDECSLCEAFGTDEVEQIAISRAPALANVNKDAFR